jgi:hypothetical protein
MVMRDGGDFKSSLADRLEARARTHARGERGSDVGWSRCCEPTGGTGGCASVNGLRGIRPEGVGPAVGGDAIRYNIAGPGS